MSVWSDAVLALNPTSFWRFEGASPLADSGSAGITLSAIGTPVRVPSLIPCEPGAANNAYELDGSTQYLTGGDNYEFTGEINWTISAWLRTDDTTLNRRILEKRQQTADTPGWLFYQSGTGNLTFDYDPGAASPEGMTEPAGVGIGQVRWTVMTWEDATDTLSMYVDGTMLGSKNTWTITPGFPASGTDPFTIGASGAGTLSFDGVIDDVAVWSGTALSSTQIASLWASAQAPPLAVKPSYPTMGLGRW